MVCYFIVYLVGLSGNEIPKRIVGVENLYLQQLEKIDRAMKWLIYCLSIDQCCRFLFDYLSFFSL
jgi:hypothetical protein